MRYQVYCPNQELYDHLRKETDYSLKMYDLLFLSKKVYTILKYMDFLHKILELNDH